MVVIFPPYYNGYGEGYAYNNGDSGAYFNATYEWVANRTTGEFTTLNINTIGTSGESSRQTVVTRANMQFYFQPDFSGQARMIVSLRREGGDSYVWGKVRDRSGVSNAYVTQRSWLDMWRPGIIDGNFARHSLVDIDYYDDGDGRTWGPTIIAADQGPVVQFQYIPNTTVTVGQWTLLEVAIIDQQYGGINDMGLDGVIQNKWNIQRVHITHV